LSISISLQAGQSTLERAEDLYQKTDYAASLEVLRGAGNPTAEAYCVMAAIT